MATLLYRIFLKSSLLFEIFLVEVKKYILSTFVSFQLGSRRISRAKEKTSLKCSKALCSKYQSLHLRKIVRDSPSWRGVMDFFSHTYDEKLQNIKNPVLSFYFYKYISLICRPSSAFEHLHNRPIN